MSMQIYFLYVIPHANFLAFNPFGISNGCSVVYDAEPIISIRSATIATCVCSCKEIV